MTFEWSAWGSMQIRAIQCTFHSVVLMNNSMLMSFVSRFEFLSRTKYKSMTRMPTSLPKSCNLKIENNQRLSTEILSIELHGITSSGAREQWKLDSDCIELPQKTVMHSCSATPHPFHDSMAYPIYLFWVSNRTLWMRYRCWLTKSNFLFHAHSSNVCLLTNPQYTYFYLCAVCTQTSENIC